MEARQFKRAFPSPILARYCIVLCCIGLDWIGLDWTGLDWTIQYSTVPSYKKLPNLFFFFPSPPNSHPCHTLPYPKCHSFILYSYLQYSFLFFLSFVSISQPSIRQPASPPANKQVTHHTSTNRQLASKQATFHYQLTTAFHHSPLLPATSLIPFPIFSLS